MCGDLLQDVGNRNIDQNKDCNFTWVLIQGLKMIHNSSHMVKMKNINPKLVALTYIE